MEFFEKAHVVKNKKSSKKNTKSEENVKKKLKQMLFGYQHSDNDLIRESAELKSQLEDSSSVSGYSDLNLTNSTNDGDRTLGTVDSEEKSDTITDSNNSSQDILSITEENDGSSQSVASLSEYDENIKSLSEDVSLIQVGLSSEDSNNDSNSSDFIVTSTDIESDYDDVELEDELEIFENISKSKQVKPNTKENETQNFKNIDTLKKKKVKESIILESVPKGKKEKKNTKDIKLELIDKPKKAKKSSKEDELQIIENITKTTKEKKNKKRKLDVDSKAFKIDNTGYNGPYRPQDDDDDDDNMTVDDLSTDMSNISIPDFKEYKGPFRPRHDSSIDGLDDTSQDASVDSVDLSSPFVSVTATDMQSQSLDDILGEYRHPTVRNLPSDSQHVVASDSVGLFETEDASVVDLQADDDVGSLIPEIDNDPTIEDIEIDTVDLETTTEPIEESTMEYDNTIQSEETYQRESSTDTIEAPINIPVNVYYGPNNNCVLVLKHPTVMYIHGKVRIHCLGGTAEIQGYTLQDKPCEVYAPNHNYAQYVRTVESQNVYYGLFSKLTSLGLTVPEAEEIVTSIGEFDVILSMQRLKSRQMEFVENNFTVTDLFTKNKNIVGTLRKASDILGCSFYLTKPLKSFEENICWPQAIKCGMNEGSRGIVCGGKGAGKSTFLRYYVNKLLASGPILVVDLDPGQCEFTVAGNLSATVVTEPLLGPNFTHLKTPELMLNIGMINTMDNPKRYAVAVETLINHCKSDERLRSLPWIVNTMGMTNSIGLKFMTFIILQTQPTFLLQIDSKSAKQRFDFHLYPQTIKNLYFEDYQNDKMFRNITEVNIDYSFFLVHHTDNAVKNNYSLAPRDERYLNFLSYFGQMLNGRSGDFLSIVPYEVHLKDISICSNVKISEDAVTKVINGKIVALCRAGDGGGGRVFTLDDTPLVCVGIGVVRGVDLEQGLVYVTGAGVGAGGAGSDALLYCDWAPELRPRGCAGAALPYRTASKYTQRRLMFAPRRRFNPLQLLKMSRAA